MTPSSSSSSAQETDQTPASDLIQNVRRELIEAQLVILDLNDRILQAETDRGDAVALLGQAELVSEQKISQIMELDRVLNLRIRELEKANEAEKAAREELGIRSAEEKAQQKHEYDQVVADLVNRLEKANQEISRAHSMAADYARDLSQSKEDHAKLEMVLATSRHETATARKSLEEREAELNATQKKLNGTETDLAQTEAELRQTQANLEEMTARESAARSLNTAYRASWPWRFSRPFRWLFGPKL